MCECVSPEDYSCDGQLFPQDSAILLGLSLSSDSEDDTRFHLHDASRGTFVLRFAQGSQKLD